MGIDDLTSGPESRDPADVSLSDLEVALLAAVGEAFPVSWAPYCDLAEAVGASEVDALNAVLELRETGLIGRVGAEFNDETLAGIALDDAEQALAFLLEGDIPYGEHPYAELAEMLQMQGIDVEETWVLARTHTWIESGVIRAIRATEPLEDDGEDGDR